MSDDLRQFTPQPPDWRLDWYGLDETYDFIQRLRDCPQSPVFHGEGDVWIHTRMVLEQLIALPAWRTLAAPERELLFCSAVLHDVGKPATTRVEGGWITSRGHSGKGARMSRRILWEMGLPPELREDIAALVRYHQLPYYITDRPDCQRLTLEISQSARTDHLTILAEADVRGRICPDLHRLLSNIAAFGQLCRDERCWAVPRVFPSDHARFLYFRHLDRDPDVDAADSPQQQMVLLAGLPGAGKAQWLAQQGFAGPSADSLPAAAAFLREGQPFAWTGTNLAREARRQIVDLAAAHQTRVKLVWIEAPRAELWERNRLRDKPVPEPVMNALLDRWETPDLCEAHELLKVW
ncbi:MAG: AAA family ATPase [Bryobacterales bacterium]|nr:AAA family ATPase [Bryobacterales bacterium]